MIKTIQITIDGKKFPGIPIVRDLKEGILYIFSAQIVKDRGEYQMMNYQLEDLPRPQVYQAGSNTNCPPDNLSARDWKMPNKSVKTSTFATLHIGHEIEPNRVVLIGFSGQISGPDIDWRCPRCKDIIKIEEGNSCKCGCSQITKDLAVQFSIESKIGGTKK